MQSFTASSNGWKVNFVSLQCKSPLRPQTKVKVQGRTCLDSYIKKLLQSSLKVFHCHCCFSQVFNTWKTHSSSEASQTSLLVYFQPQPPFQMSLSGRRLHRSKRRETNDDRKTQTQRTDWSSSRPSSVCLHKTLWCCHLYVQSWLCRWETNKDWAIWDWAIHYGSQSTTGARAPMFLQELQEFFQDLSGGWGQISTSFPQDEWLHL